VAAAAAPVAPLAAAAAAAAAAASNNINDSKRLRRTFRTPVVLRDVNVFERKHQVGEGTYGSVFVGKDKQTNEIVALKRFNTKQEENGFPITAIREVKILKELKHPNIVKLKEIVTSKGMFVALAFFFLAIRLSLLLVCVCCFYLFLLAAVRIHAFARCLLAFFHEMTCSSIIKTTPAENESCAKSLSRIVRIYIT
jgi:serine/threonine protein kinase